MKSKMDQFLYHVALLVICSPTSSTAYGLEVPLTGTQIDEKYTFSNETHGSGGFGDVYVGHTNAKHKVHVVMKLENKHGAKDKKAENEAKVYQHLHKKYGDLVQHHLVNMLDHGKYEDKHDAIILTKGGFTLSNLESRKQLRKQPGNKPDWPKFCKIMTQLLHAVEHMHRANVAHLDIRKDENVLFGLEPEPVNGVRLPGVTYKNDVYLLDLGNSKVLTEDKSATGRLDDLISLGRLLCSILNDNPLSFIDWPHRLPDVKKYFDNKHPFKIFPPEMRAALSGYHQEMKELEAKKLTEEQLKATINYEKLCSYFK